MLIRGTSGSGKSRLALTLIDALPGELILDLGAYLVQRSRVGGPAFGHFDDVESEL